MKYLTSALVFLSIVSCGNAHDEQGAHAHGEAVPQAQAEESTAEREL